MQVSGLCRQDGDKQTLSKICPGALLWQKIDFSRESKHYCRNSIYSNFCYCWRYYFGDRYWWDPSVFFDITKPIHFSLRQDLKGTLQQELDFLNEGVNSERCARDLANLPYVYVPRVHWDLCSKVGVTLIHLIFRRRDTRLRIMVCAVV